MKARVWPQALCSTDKLNKISTASQMGFQNNLRTRNSKAKIETLIFGHFKIVIYGCQKYSTSRKRKFCSQYFIPNFKNCMFSSCYHALLGVAIFIFIKRSKIIASRIHLYKKENSETWFLDIPSKMERIQRYYSYGSQECW